MLMHFPFKKKLILKFTLIDIWIERKSGKFQLTLLRKLANMYHKFRHLHHQVKVVTESNTCQRHFTETFHQTLELLLLNNLFPVSSLNLDFSHQSERKENKLPNMI